MPISLDNANLVVKDNAGNTGIVKTLTAADVVKIKNAISDVGVVVNPTTHVAIPATTTSTGVVQLADAAAVTAGTAGRVVDAAQLKSAVEGIDLSDYVDKTTAQTISGVKTFTALPQSSVAPTVDADLANKKYVDDTTANMVTTDTTQDISGVKTFLALPQSAVAPTTNNQLTNKAYVDTAVANSASIEVDSTYVEPAVRKGILSSAVDCITAPSSSHTFEARGAVTGQLIMFCGTTIPDGYLLCNGAAVSRSTYADLFAVIGTLYGAGDGSTTFNLPDCRDRVIQGASSTYAVGTYIPAGLPNIRGELGTGYHLAWLGTGAYTIEGEINNRPVASFDGDVYQCPWNWYFNAKRHNSLYKDDATVQNPAVAAYTLIKV